MANGGKFAGYEALDPFFEVFREGLHPFDETRPHFPPLGSAANAARDATTS